MELSKYLRDYSRTIAGKEQLLIGGMAKALEIIPRQLCDNAGFDATNILNKLRQRHALGKFGCSGRVCRKCSVSSGLVRIDRRSYPHVLLPDLQGARGMGWTL